MPTQEEMNQAAGQFAALYLMRKGWFATLEGSSVDDKGALPWLTYPAIMQLSRLIKPHHRVFEYGCGHSSIWFSQRAAEVVSVEHDAEWAGRLAALGLPNVKVTHRGSDAPVSDDDQRILEPFFAGAPKLPLSRDAEHNLKHGLVTRGFLGYAAELLRYPKATFDIILVDGMARCLTAWLAGQYVKSDGIIIFDNADRWQYNAAFRFLSEQGFRRIDFCGPAPVSRLELCTAIFVRSLDCFADSIESPRGGENNDLGW